MSSVSDLSENYSDHATTNSCVDINDFLSEQAFDWTSLTAVRILVAVVYGLIFCVGIFGNAGVIVKVAKNRKLQSARNIFLLSLMASDFLLCLTAVPVMPVSVIIKRWIFGGIICRLLPLCQSMSVIITSLSLTAIAIDKYIHIMDVTKAPVTMAQASAVVAVIWLVAGVLNLPLVLSYDVFDGDMFKEEYGVTFCGEFCDEIHWHSPEYKRVYGTSVTCIQFIIPMVIIIFCYSRLLRKIRADMMIDNKQFSKSLSGLQRVGAIRKRRKVNYILIMMVIAFIGAWLPLTLFNILRDYNLVPEFVKDQPFIWALIVHSTAMTTVIWNPLLFFWLTRRTRRHGRRDGSIEESIVVSFLLASNPVRLILRKRRRFRETITIDDDSACEATFAENEYSNASVTYAATSATVYKKDNWLKKKFSANSASTTDSSIICKQLPSTSTVKRKVIKSHDSIVYQNKNAKPAVALNEKSSLLRRTGSTMNDGKRIRYSHRSQKTGSLRNVHRPGEIVYNSNAMLNDRSKGTKEK